MEINGIVLTVLPKQSYVSKRSGEVIEKFFFVIETEGQYPKKVCFSVMDKDKWAQWGVHEGMKVSVSFDVESREWNGKWFTDLRCWNLTVNADGNATTTTQAPVNNRPAAASPQPAPVAAPQAQEAADDLPF